MTQHIPDDLISAAQTGDAAALDLVVRRIQERVYRLSRRFLYDPDLAAEATQDILIRIVTKLSTFSGQSRFETWVHRVAVNHLLTARKLIAADPGLRFADFSEDLLRGIADETAQAPEDHVMLNELRVTCTMAMLLCLDREHRMAYVLGDILQMDQAEAADILGIRPDNFRKRLSRARAEVVAFTTRTCAMAGPKAPCSCRRRLPAAKRAGRLGEAPSPELADAPALQDVRRNAQRLEAEEMVGFLQRATGSLRPSRDIAADVMRLLTPND